MSFGQRRLRQAAEVYVSYVNRKISPALTPPLSCHCTGRRSEEMRLPIMGDASLHIPYR